MMLVNAELCNLPLLSPAINASYTCFPICVQKTMKNSLVSPVEPGTFPLLKSFNVAVNSLKVISSSNTFLSF